MRFGSRILALAAVSLAAACGGGGGDTTSPTPVNTTPTPPTPPTPPPTTGPVLTNAVTVSNDAFTPPNIQVSPGTTVTWTWDGSAITHNVTFADSSPGSGDKGAGATFSRTFTTAGTFGYVCTIHAGLGMVGSVVVK